jgi:hypothetical protein
LLFASDCRLPTYAGHIAGTAPLCSACLLRWGLDNCPPLSSQVSLKLPSSPSPSQVAGNNYRREPCAWLPVFLQGHSCHLEAPPTLPSSPKCFQIQSHGGRASTYGFLWKQARRLQQWERCVFGRLPLAAGGVVWEEDNALALLALALPSAHPMGSHASHFLVPSSSFTESPRALLAKWTTCTHLLMVP